MRTFPPASPSARRPRRPGVSALAAALLLAAAPAAAQVDPPSLAGVDVNLFLLGDGGLPRAGKPQAGWVLDAAKREIRRDPQAAQRARVLFLGDNVYGDSEVEIEEGMPPVGHPHRARAEGILRDQVGVVLDTGVEGWFVPGNHEWYEGRAAVRREVDFVRQVGQGRVDVLPADGCPGPEVRDLGTRVSLVYLDTEFWIRTPWSTESFSDCPHPTRAAARDALGAALAGVHARGRVAVLAAHHPFASYGPHGAELEPDPQDLKHPIYRAMIQELRSAFGAAPPLLLANGHDHLLQVIRAAPFQLVSGTSAKRGSVKTTPKAGDYAGSVYGFFQVLFYADGGVRVDVLEARSATSSRRVKCVWLRRRATGGAGGCDDWTPPGG